MQPAVRQVLRIRDQDGIASVQPGPALVARIGYDGFQARRLRAAIRQPHREGNGGSGVRRTDLLQDSWIDQIARSKEASALAYAGQIGLDLLQGLLRR